MLQTVETPFQDTALVKARQQNHLDPTSLHQTKTLIRSRWHKHNSALLLTGELRCLSRSQLLFKELRKAADIFIVTTAAYAGTAERLTRSNQILIVDELISEAERDQRFPVGSMRQWHKLHLALQLVQGAEQRRRRRYSHLLKLRSDYFYVHPQHLIEDVIHLTSHPTAGWSAPPTRCLADPAI